MIKHLRFLGYGKKLRIKLSKYNYASAYLNDQIEFNDGKHHIKTIEIAELNLNLVNITSKKVTTHHFF